MFRRKKQEAAQDLFSPIERVAKDRADRLAEQVLELAEQLHAVADQLRDEIRNEHTNGDVHAR